MFLCGFAPCNSVFSVVKALKTLTTETAQRYTEETHRECRNAPKLDSEVGIQQTENSDV